MDTDNKSIIIGLSDYPYCDCISWPLAWTVNLADYHTVVALLRPFNTALPDLQASWLDVIAAQLTRLVNTKGRLVIVYHEDLAQKIAAGNGDIRQLRRSYRNAMPGGFLVTTESGNTISCSQKSVYDNYLEKLKEWTFYVNETAPGKIHHRFRVSREGRVLACRIKTNDHGFTILPQIPELTDTDTATEILRAIKYPIGPTPIWAKDIELPGLQKIDAEISEQGSLIIAANARLDELKLVRSEKEIPIRLLYASGPDLEKVVADVFVKLGATISENSYGNEDIVLIIDGQEYIVEVTGNKKSLALTKVRQLSDHVFEAMEKTEGQLKGILVSNPLRELPPSERDGAEICEYPANVLRSVQQYQMALVPARWLFDRYCDVLESKLDGAAVLQQIVITDGLVKTE